MGTTRAERMDTQLIWMIGVVTVGWFTVAAIVARRGYQWHRDRSRPVWVALTVSIAAGLLWPISLYVWDLDWAVTGRDRRRSNR